MPHPSPARQHVRSPRRLAETLAGPSSLCRRSVVVLSCITVLFYHDDTTRMRKSRLKLSFIPGALCPLSGQWALRALVSLWFFPVVVFFLGAFVSPRRHDANGNRARGERKEKA